VSSQAKISSRQFADRRWRLNNLYWITDEHGRRVPFRMNWAQEALFDGMHHVNLILKARQLGMTTFAQLFMLDMCVFRPNIRAGTIAHTLPDAQAIFRDKVRYPYDNLPAGLRAHVPLIRHSANELALANNSILRVATSHRSGTLQYLHVSEYGKMCARYPEKAREVRTGALNTVQAGQVIFIESTAEGQEGHLYELCEDAQARQRTGAPLTPLDAKFFFFPWWQAPKYRIAPDGVAIPEDLARYFAQLEQQGIRLDAAQKAWYTRKAATQLGDMKREYPSTPKEAFEASVEGAYFGALMEAAETQGRIGTFKANPDYPVHTAWDIGRSDYTSIWFWQRFVGRLRLVGFYQNSGEGLPHYAREVQNRYAANRWMRKGGIDYVPHDARVTEWGTDKSRIEQMFKEKLNPRIAPELSLEDGINAVRATLPMCEFDAEGCAEGIRMLKSYRKEWNEEAGCWRDRPRHDLASHGADAFRYLACAHRDLTPPKVEKPKPAADPMARVGNQPLKEPVRGGLTVDELLRLHDTRIKPNKWRV
jgi:hypothetical protein